MRAWTLSRTGGLVRQNALVADWEERRLFDVEDVPPALKKAARSPLPAQRLWTESKARLIERYLFGFLMVTKDGTYIDAFAGPQDPDHPDTWAANLVLELRPPWLRNFYLFENHPASVVALEELRHRHPDRHVRVYQGDSNRRIHEVLNPDMMDRTPDPRGTHGCGVPALHGARVR